MRSILWAALEPVRGREQGGHRPSVVISSHGYLEAIDTPAVVVPVTTVGRGWPNHVALDGQPALSAPSWAMTEQIRTLSRTRVTRVSGAVSARYLREIRRWIADFLDLRLA